MRGTVSAGLTGLLLLAAVAAGAQPMPGMPAKQGEPVEHGTRRAGGLEVTLLSAPPLSADEIQRMMSGMGGAGGKPGMGAMPGTGGPMRGMPGPGGLGTAEPPTHWIGVVVRDVRTDRVVPDLDVTLTARKGGLSRAVKLMPMPGSYGANLSLPEKGRYSVIVTLVRVGARHTVDFEFDSR